MDPRPTCGQGLAENSLLPGKLGELTAAMAETLDAHMQMLNVDDPQSRQEYDVYFQLANEQRETAARLLATANEMAGARDMPMGRHEITNELASRLTEAFSRYVQVEQELLVLLQHISEQDRAMLAEMSGKAS